MTNSNQIDASTLVLKMVGGKLDGKLLPISTQKCFLTGGQQDNKDQCAIVRGPSGTAIKSTDRIQVNNQLDTLHWLSEGDTIRIGQTVMIVEQLGSFGQSPEKSNDNAKQLESVHTSTQAVEPTSTQDSFQQESPYSLSQAMPELPATPRSPEPTDKVEETVDSSPTDFASPQPNLDRILKELQTSEEAPPVSDSPEAVEQPSSDSHSELQAFLNSTQSSEMGQTPDEKHSEPAASSSLQEQPESTPEIAPTEEILEAKDQEEQNQVQDSRLNNELLERALQSLKNSPIEEPVDASFEEQPVMSTEQNVDQQLDEIQNQIETQIQDFDSVDASAPPTAELTADNTATDSQDTTVEPQSVETAAQSVEEIMSRLSNPDSPQVQSESLPEEAPAAHVDSASEALSNVPAQIEETQIELPQATDSAAESVEDIMARLRASNPPSMETESSANPIEESPVLDPPAMEQVTQTEPNLVTESDHEVEVVDATPAESIESIMQRLGATSNEDAVPTQEPITPELPSMDTFAAEAEPLTDENTESSLPATNELDQPEPIEQVASVPEDVTPDEPTPPTPEEQSSVAAVLARMQSAGKLEDYNAPDEDQLSPAAEAQATVVEPIPAEVPGAAPAEGGDVQDYMNQLFQRLRGSDAPKSALPAEKSESVPEPTVEYVAPSEMPKEVERVLTPTEYVPQQQAPEEKSHMEAMRQLANKQKHAAVQICSSKRSQMEQTINQCVGLSCFVASSVLGWMASSFSDPLAIASFGCGVASLIAAFRYVSGLKKPSKGKVVANAAPAQEAPENEVAQ